MIADTDRKLIQEISKKYHAKRVVLFGSSLSSTTPGRDIDIGVEGVSPALFFDFYGDLMLALSKPIDVIDLSGSSKFAEIVRREGVVLYG
jgi:predicted nucleotidyltransferase